MDIALRVGDAGAAQLAAGVADKLREAVAKYGDLLTPTSTDGRAVLGQEFRMLADHAGLQAVEMGVLNNWLELAYSAEVAARFQLDVPTFNVANVPLQLVPPPGRGAAASRPRHSGDSGGRRDFQPDVPGHVRRAAACSSSSSRPWPA